jgi:hypothetical protein
MNDTQPIEADRGELLAVEACDFEGDPFTGRLLWLDVGGRTVRIYLGRGDADDLAGRLAELADDIGDPSA